MPNPRPHSGSNSDTPTNFSAQRTCMDPTEASQHFQTALQPLLVQAISHLANGIMITDEAGRIVWVNEAFCRLSGYSEDEILGRKPSLLKSGRQGPEFYAQLWRTLQEGKVWQGKIVDTRKDGSLYTADETITPLRDDDGTIRHFVALQQDITERDRTHEQDRFLARHDALTGLPNRAMLHEAVQMALSSASRTQQLVAFMFLDLDGFKAINDELGHAVGDQLLAAVAERLRTGMRLADTIARVGGDEFAALVSGIDSRTAAATLANKLLDSFAPPFVVRGQRFTIHASVGIAVFPADGTDGNTLMERADLAMYYAKLQGGNRHQFYEPSLSRSFAVHRGAATGLAQ